MAKLAFSLWPSAILFFLSWYLWGVQHCSWCSCFPAHAAKDSRAGSALHELWLLQVTRPCGSNPCLVPASGLPGPVCQTRAFKPLTASQQACETNSWLFARWHLKGCAPIVLHMNLDWQRCAHRMPFGREDSPATFTSAAGNNRPILSLLKKQ